MYVGKTLILQEPGLEIAVHDGALHIRRAAALLQRYPLTGLQEIVLFWGVTEEGRAVAALLEAGITVSRIGYSGRHECTMVAQTDPRVLLRVEQYRAFFDNDRRLDLAKCFIEGKIKNQKKEMSRLSHSRGASAKNLLDALDDSLKSLHVASTLEQAMGVEGMAARMYFRDLSELISPVRPGIYWERRTRRPPLSPEDALLSFGYALLSGLCRGAVEGCGLDSHLGFLHAPAAGRPSLALDLMEEFRSDYVDRLVATLVNRREFTEKDFVESLGAFSLREAPRKRFLEAWSDHLDTVVPYRLLVDPIPRRAVPHWQARTLAGALLEGGPYRPYRVTAA